MKYIRQEMYIGWENQEKLRNKTICIAGLGALGSAASNLLTRTGVKELILIDRDVVEESNLQRQSLFEEKDVGKSKALVLKKKLSRINKDVKIKAYFDDLDSENIELIKSDLILDCTDNLDTRFLINEFCVKNKIPFVYGAAIGSSGYIFNIIPEKTCFNCIFKEVSGLDTCETFGVLNTITNLIASMQVNEAIKILLNKDYEKKLLYFNLDNNSMIKIDVEKNKDCLVCGKKIFDYLNGKKNKEMIKFCGSSNYLIKGNFDYEKVKKNVEKEKINITVFRNKVLIKAKDEKEAKSLYSKFVG
ncbi:HesA/MoeB/ThiF family protein, partial [Candidatus Woesearchaeota archaeon]|nr:HesA/MoeB/ThiF family protein [Candidatus Woesearchaeota archaeon]